jgi:hypothetical protein
VPERLHNLTFSDTFLEASDIATVGTNVFSAVTIGILATRRVQREAVRNPIKARDRTEL